MSRVWGAIFDGIRNTADAGVEALARQHASPPKKKRRAKKQEECSPCAAMDAVDAARARVQSGQL